MQIKSDKQTTETKNIQIMFFESIARKTDNEAPTNSLRKSNELRSNDFDLCAWWKQTMMQYFFDSDWICYFWANMEMKISYLFGSQMVPCSLSRLPYSVSLYGLGIVRKKQAIFLDVPNGWRNKIQNEKYETAK